uniref:Uncharacterized protein n=1 Tax=Oryza sativa subsp. japonica TaxID=39947 RepID=Q8LIA7_ORYSJ|nr:hypothetical protein [Oryza sativa Japonica Group]
MNKPNDEASPLAHLPTVVSSFLLGSSVANPPISRRAPAAAPPVTTLPGVYHAKISELRYGTPPLACGYSTHLLAFIYYCRLFLSILSPASSEEKVCYFQGQIVGSAATIGTKKIWEYLGALGHIIILVGLSMLMSPPQKGSRTFVMNNKHEHWVSWLPRRIKGS